MVGGCCPYFWHLLVLISTGDLQTVYNMLRWLHFIVAIVWNSDDASWPTICISPPRSGEDILWFHA